jgi:hypothetical protein
MLILRASWFGLHCILFISLWVNKGRIQFPTGNAGAEILAATLVKILPTAHRLTDEHCKLITKFNYLLLYLHSIHCLLCLHYVKFLGHMTRILYCPHNFDLIHKNIYCEICMYRADWLWWLPFWVFSVRTSSQHQFSWLGYSMVTHIQYLQAVFCTTASSTFLPVHFSPTGKLALLAIENVFK